MILYLVFTSVLAVVVNIAAQSETIPNNKQRRPHVIGAGLGRTGTMSFKRALETLNVGPVFHMEDSIARIPELSPLWRDLALLTPIPRLDGNPLWPPRLSDRNEAREKAKRVELLRTILGLNQTYWNQSHAIGEVYHSHVDFPLCIYFRDMIDAFRHDRDDDSPIKVILTTRESGRKWAASALSSILSWHPSRRKFGVKIMFATLYRSDMLQNTFYRYFPDVISDDDDDMLAEMHDSWNEHVRDVMQKYALANNLELKTIFLDYQVSQGWAPLCEFLEMNEDCPSTEPFPHVNDREAYQKSIQDVNKLGYFILAIIVFCAVMLIVLLKFIFRRYRQHSRDFSEESKRSERNVIKGKESYKLINSGVTDEATVDHDLEWKKEDKVKSCFNDSV